MRIARPSKTAQYVAVVRTVLDRKGAIRDPVAGSLLTPAMRGLAAVLSTSAFDARTNSGVFAAIAARTLFFDGEVTAALDGGIRQIVTVGAGYDSRAWRFSRPGARFFEVDHPATQADKQHRAPAVGPTYVPVDLTDASITEALVAAGLDRECPALFVVEGVTMYLAEREVHRLLVELAEVASQRSRLAVNFGPPRRSGGAVDQLRQRTQGLVSRAGGEAHVFLLGAAEAGPFVASTGWKVDRTVTLREVAAASFLSGGLRIGGINPEASAVSATAA